MEFIFNHVNINITDIDRSVEFYQKALGLRVERQKKAADGSFILTFMEDGKSGARLEMTWLRNHQGPYDLGENENHLAFFVEDYEKAHEFHQNMGIICYENPAMNLYFISDPDGYWIEILKPR
ncbi:MAG: VOC family protein [Clostridia bacterium]|nr:VOC family protein [Clostridia bacterium]MDD4798046.1 VOC family protein [Clostridia bacterium]